MRPGTLILLGALAGILGTAQGCAMEAEGAMEPAAGAFIALARDFEGFREWRRYEIPDIGTSSGHDPGSPRYLYVEDDAPAWGEPFPEGTIVVKTLEIGAPSEWEVHAMVKRGGGYNPEGALGWEWFDLVLNPDSGVFIAWRGEGSAADPGGYVDVAATGCNGCHSTVAGSDFVFTRALFTPDPAMP